MLTRIRHLLEMIRFSHTIFALPFALLAGLMAAQFDHFEFQWNRPFRLQQIAQALRNTSSWKGFNTAAAPTLLTPPSDEQIRDAQREALSNWKPTWSVSAYTFQVLIAIIVCMVSARSAAMAFNRLVDWKLDSRNPRTEKRHIPTGVLSVAQVTAFFVVCSLGFVAGTALFLPNRLPLYLSVPVLLFLCGYSYAKRFTALAHFWLGAALMLAPISAWIAVRGEEVIQNPMDLLPAVILGAAVMLWVAGFDMIYACQDIEFDKQAGLHSVPAKIGVKNALRLAAVCHLGMILLLASLPWFYPLFGWVYWSGIAAVAVLLVYEHSLVRPDDLTRVNVAFFNVNAMVSIGLLVIGALDLLT